jgi:hypothetical protein|eukprot:COSAG06_NODE_1407_length_9550_cov_1.910380_3_plen_42_part_00
MLSATRTTHLTYSHELPTYIDYVDRAASYIFETIMLKLFQL